MSKHAKHLILASWPLSPNHLTWADSLMCSFLFVSILVIPIGNLSPNLTSYQVSLPTFKPCFTLLVLSFCHKSLLPLISTHSTLPRDASSPVSCTYLDGWSQIFTSSNFPTSTPCTLNFLLFLLPLIRTHAFCLLSTDFHWSSLQCKSPLLT